MWLVSLQRLQKFSPEMVSTDVISLMATTACEIHYADKRFNWTGYHRVTGPSMVKIGPYQGGHGCLKIPLGRGVSGAAAATGEVQLVDDVSQFDDHVACSSTNQSEIVLPVYDATGELIAVLDIYSNQPAAFTQEDVDGLEAIISKTFRKIVV